MKKGDLFYCTLFMDELFILLKSIRISQVTLGVDNPLDLYVPKDLM